MLSRKREASMSNDNADLEQMLPNDLRNLKQEVLTRIASMGVETGTLEQKIIGAYTIRKLHEFLKDIEAAIQNHEKGEP
jgi:hypothetical protein